MGTDDGDLSSDGSEIISPDGSVMPEVEEPNSPSNQSQNYSISNNALPSFKKILVPDDGKDLSYQALNYAVSLANSTGAELVILRILEDGEKFKDVTGDETNDSSQTHYQTFQMKIKREIIDNMEEKIKKFQGAGFKNKISYKFRTGKADDEIVKEINDNNFDLLVLTSSHIDSWIRSLFSDARKIISNINIPVLIIQ